MTISRDLVYVIIIAALLILLGISAALYKKLNSKYEGQASILAEKDSQIKYWKTKDGKTVAEKEAAIATISQLKEAYPEAIKEITKDFDVKMKDLRAYIKNEIKASGSGNGTVIHNHYDSAGHQYPYWQLKAGDGYLDFTADVIDSLHVPFKYNYVDTITTVISQRREGKFFGRVFGKEHLYATTKLQNPRASVVGARTFMVDSYKDKRFVVFVGAGYDGLNNRPAIVIGLGYSLFKF